MNVCAHGSGEKVTRWILFVHAWPFLHGCAHSRRYAFNWDWLVLKTRRRISRRIRVKARVNTPYGDSHRQQLSKFLVHILIITRQQQQQQQQILAKKIMFDVQKLPTPKGRVELLETIGKGNFGFVYKVLLCIESVHSYC